MRLSGQRDSIGRPVKLYGADGFAGMRAAGALAAATLDFIAPHVVPGITTLALDRLLETFMRDHGAGTGDHRLSRLPPCELHLGQSCRHPRHTVRVDAAGAGRHPQHRRDPQAQRLARGFEPHVCRGRGGAGGAAADRCDLRGDDERHRRGQAGGHLGDVGAAVEAVARREGYSIVVDFVGTASGGCSMTRPTWCIAAPAAAASASSRG